MPAEQTHKQGKGFNYVTKPTVIYIPGPNENPAKMIQHDNTNHSAAMAYVGYEGNVPNHKTVQSHVKDVFEKMKQNGYKSPLICLVEGAIWSDTIMTSH